jgi:hypothetical protein
MSLSTSPLRLGTTSSTIAAGAAVGILPLLFTQSEAQVGSTYVDVNKVEVAAADLLDVASSAGWSLQPTFVQPTSRSTEDLSRLLSLAHGELTSRRILTGTAAAESAAADLRASLEGYSRLEDGWDGPRSKAPSSRSIEIAELLLDRLPDALPSPKAMLSANGEVGFYWNLSNMFADLVIEDDHTVSLFIRAKDSGTEDLFEGLPVEGISGRSLDELLAKVAFRDD